VTRSIFSAGGGTRALRLFPGKSSMWVLVLGAEKKEEQMASPEHIRAFRDPLQDLSVHYNA
jgi:hypothetical protein